MRLTSLRLKPETRYKRITTWLGLNIKFTAEGIKITCTKQKLGKMLVIHQVLFKHLCKVKPKFYGSVPYEAPMSEEQFAAC